ncbi:MAG: phenylalanine--tRNA ligase subunit beta [Kineosporiaceae bacterium]|jgi:phenylalanyl-tRNA synthetase beta chain
MRVPLPWLAEYVALPAGVTGGQVAADLVRVGLEEEGIHGGDVRGPLVVGRVLGFADEPQKNGRTIRWCSVDVGDLGVEAPDGTRQPRGIVCGASNFDVGDLVVVVLPGAVLPGPFPITARKTYGHVSDGMICSARELGLGDDHDGIIRLVEWGLGDAAVGSDALALLGLGEETVEVNVTPDRGYALSVRGVARDYALSTGAAFTDPAAVDVPKPTDDAFAVRVDDVAPIHGVPGCDRYVARVVRGIDASRPSPAWMRRRLEQAGMRPISLAVDVTNYVMLAVGQPLHAFDLDALVAPVVVRRARAGERLTTLDDVERALDPEDLLITDDDGRRVLALAGVMGGASSEVSATTTDILLEAAHFDPVTVARTARRHRLSTEASRRFERGVDTDLADRAAELAVRLLVEHAGGTAGAVTDVDERVAIVPVELRTDLAERVIGVPLDRDSVVAHLERMECRVAPGGSGRDVLSVTPPSWRPDLRIPVDLVEEIARLVGYDAIPSVLPVAPAGRGLSHGQRARRSVARALAEHGLVEVLTYPFATPQVHDAFGLAADDPRRRSLRLANPLSDEQPLLRTSLLATLVDALRRNVGRGTSDVGLFETGLVTRPDRLDAVAPQLPVGVLPSPDELAALDAAVPPQPRRVALVLAGNRTLPGWYGPARPVDWTDALDAALLVARTLGVDVAVSKDEHAPWHPGRCARLELDGVLVGHAGELHPKVVEALGLPSRTCAAEIALDVLVAASGGVRRARPVSTFPVAKEDVALVVDDDVPAAAVEDALREGAGDLLEQVRLFDVYSGPQVGAGRKSLAFALRLRAPDRTLTAAEAAAVRDAAVAAAAARTAAVLRGS